ncbi:hypothetical protein QVD99_001806 [Batrachochytrium dendrobatidis]|nr:hypothetical protein QVD99_001806 [Batrachochytrium dendrobatidis]
MSALKENSDSEQLLKLQVDKTDIKYIFYCYFVYMFELITPSQNNPSTVAYQQPLELSSVELRARLVHSLHCSGVADKLKSQLRAKLYAELHLRSGIPRHKALDDGSNVLLFKVIDSLLVGYFQERKLDFTLSVFVPETGLGHSQKALGDKDVLHALHIDKPCDALRKMEKAMESRNPEESLLVRLFSSIAYINDVQKTDKEMQTNTDLEDILSIKINQVEQSLLQERKNNGQIHSHLIEDRLSQYQNQLELQMKQDLKDQLQKFQELELAQMRIDEKSHYKMEIAKQKMEYDNKILEFQERQISIHEAEQLRLTEKEKALEHQNIQLRQKLLDESNSTMLKEVQLRHEAELHTRQIRLERDLLQRRVEEVQSQVLELQSFKERYTQQMESQLAQYKIDLNNKHATQVSEIKIDRVHLEAERAQLKEKTLAVEKMHANIQYTEDERDALRESVKNAHQRIEALIKEKDDAVLHSKEIQLELLTNRGSTALEFEITSLKKQLIETEKTANKRQEEYQELLKNLMLPKDDFREELGKSRMAEARWQRECQQLVQKLEYELNRSDELQRLFDQQVLKTRELERELADTRLLLHQTQSALTTELAHHSIAPASRQFHITTQQHRELLPDPLDPQLDHMYSKIVKRTPLHTEFNGNMDKFNAHNSSSFNQQIGSPSINMAQHIMKELELNDVRSQSENYLHSCYPSATFANLATQSSIVNPPVTLPSFPVDAKQPKSTAILQTMPPVTSDLKPSPNHAASSSQQCFEILPVDAEDNSSKIPSSQTFLELQKTQSKPETNQNAAPTLISNHSIQDVEKEKQELDRVLQERQQREEQRQLEDRKKQEAIFQEKQRLIHQEKQTQERLEQQRIKEEKDILQKELEQKEKNLREANQAAEISKKKEDPITSLENDPILQRYMSLVQERRDRQKMDQVASLTPQVQQQPTLQKKMALHSEKSLSSDNLFGDGNTADDVSAPNDDTSESPSW